MLPKVTFGPLLASADGAHLVSQKFACTDCHTTREWSPSTITPQSHARFFELRGAHAAVACAKCHEGGRFVGTATRCASCHFDPHGGRLGDDCAHCHDERAFREVRNFDHRAVSGYFALAGAHGKLRCAECHGERNDRLRSLGREYGCADCHAPKHGRQFGTECSGCHQPTRFSDVPPFDHARTGFPLERRHAAVACLTCHDARRGERLSPECQTCHGDPHRGALSTACADCHRADRWLLVRFDHDRTEFPLRGKHFIVPCTKCHTNNLWTGTRSECVVCHAKDRPAMNHPPRWDCGTMGCHKPFTWTPG